MEHVIDSGSDRRYPNNTN